MEKKLILVLQCVCGKEVEAEWNRKEDGTIRIKPCPDCLAEEQDKAFDQGFDKGYDKRSQEE